MTDEQEQLEAQSRAAIKAWCDDPSVQLECCSKDSYHWSIKKNAWFDLEGHYYRIAKPKKWYRVAKMRDVIDIEPYTVHVTSEVDEDLLESDREFIEWLDERKYYD